jgi:hypothetical protein
MLILILISPPLSHSNSVVGSILSNLRERSFLPPPVISQLTGSGSGLFVVWIVWIVWVVWVILVLVLGMCFFAGGMRFSEQGFGASASLLYLFFGVRTSEDQ